MWTTFATLEEGNSSDPSLNASHDGSHDDEDDGLCFDETILLPFLNEREWSKNFRACIYFAGLMYMFLGIAIAADIFMCAIEKITTQTIRIRVKAKGSTNVVYKEVLIWNPTVANLTLMALGTSSPEILLAIIEVLGRKFHSGDLGPGTIVGSAAFNQLLIPAACISSIANGDTRRIDQFLVYIVTNIFSLFAYLWLLVVLIAISPNVVEVWEAAVTFLFFFVLVVTAYCADRQFCCRRRNRVADSTAKGPSETEAANGATKKKSTSFAIAKAVSTVTNGHVIESSRPLTARSRLQFDELAREAAAMFPNATSEQLAEWVKMKLDDMKPRSKAFYRRMSRRRQSNFRAETPEAVVDSPSRTAAASVVEFDARRYAINEPDGPARLKILRKGPCESRCTVTFQAVDGSDRAAHTGTVVFEPGETEKVISVPITEADVQSEDEALFVKLSIDDAADVALGMQSIAQVVVVGDLDAPRIEFREKNLVVKENVGVARIEVNRSGSVNQKVMVGWATQNGTALAGKEYRANSGLLAFEAGEVQKMVEVELVDEVLANKSATFDVVLRDVSGGGRFGANKRVVVTIVNDENVLRNVHEADKIVTRFVAEGEPLWKAWREQFVKAMNVNDGDIASATGRDYAMHAFTFGWKFIFAFVPPPSFLGGYVSFIVSLAIIGLQTALVGDMATIFGCLVGLEDVITAITLVAIGTSMPDLFASRFAALQDSNADNSIGNVNGSNSVNVFLGLGLPWLLATVYWSYNDGVFEVASHGLTFSVIIYSICSVFCTCLFFMRRRLAIFGRAELGGPSTTKYASTAFLASLWILYVLLSALQVKGFIPSF